MLLQFYISGLATKGKNQFDLSMENLTETCISKRIHAIVVSGHCILFDGQVLNN